MCSWDEQEKVRAVAFKALGKLYNSAFPDMYVLPPPRVVCSPADNAQRDSESHDEHATMHFGWIPGLLLDGLAFTEGTNVTSS